jgi:hypothetical protein
MRPGRLPAVIRPRAVYLITPVQFDCRRAPISGRGRGTPIPRSRGIAIRFLRPRPALRLHKVCSRRSRLTTRRTTLTPRRLQEARESGARKTANSARPFAGRHEGAITQFQEDAIIPKTPLDVALLIAGGPWGRGLKVGALTLGALLNSASDAKAGPLTRFFGANWAEQIAKARRGGFFPELYGGHGTNVEINRGFDFGRRGRATGAAPAELGVWLQPLEGNDVAIANHFAEQTAKKYGGRPQIVPLWPRADKIGRMNLEGMGPREVAANVAEAWDNGFDALLMRNHSIAPFGVNSGVARSIKFLEAIAGIPQDGKPDDTLIRTVANMPPRPVITELCNKRLVFLKGLKTWPVFGNGWGRRVAEVKDAALKTADAVRVPTPAPLKEPKGKSEKPDTTTKPAVQSKTVWAQIATVLTALGGALADWRVLAVVVVAALAGYVIWERMKRPDISGVFQ